MNTTNQRCPKCASYDKNAATCCFLGCDKKATKLIYSEPIFYDTYTHSCDEHIEELKLNDDDIVENLS